MRIQTKRVYDPPEDSDGYRVLVDRLWPRGVRKESLPFDLWAQFLAPSTEARKEFGHKAENFPTFKTRYQAELDANPEAARFVQEMLPMNPSAITLLYAAKDPHVNHAVVLAEWLQRWLP